MSSNIQVLSDNRLFPTIFNVVQGSNNVDTVVYTLENYIVGETDLSTYDWYVHLFGVDGIDAVKLTSAIVDGKLQVTFDLTEYVTRLGNTLTYQLVAKDDVSSVWNSAKGVILNAESINADDKIVADYPSILRQWELRLEEMAGSLDTAIYFIKYNETLPKEKRVAGRLYFKYLYAENKNGQLEDSNGNILIPEPVAKNIGITAIDDLTAGTVQEALQALKVMIENKDSLPAQSGNGGKYLRTNGESAEWAEVEALPEQDDQDGKFLKSVNGKAEWADMPRGLPLLSSIWADHKLNDASYLRADNFSWHSGDVYKAAYEHLAEDVADVEVLYAFRGSGNPAIGDNIAVTTVYAKTETVSVGCTVYLDANMSVSSTVTGVSGNTITSIASVSGYDFPYSNGYVRNSAYDYMSGSKTDTIGDITIAYYQAEDGHKICLPDQESKIMDLYESTGVAWYYLLDTENKQFKLPRTKYGFTGLRDKVGGYVPESLPNIRAESNGNSVFKGGGGSFTGAFVMRDGSNEGLYGSGNGTYFGVDFDASLSSPTYQDNAPVQERATQMYLYFYVGNYVRGLDEIDVGALAEQINDGCPQPLNNLGTVTGTVTLNANKIYSVVIGGDLTFVLPSDVNTSYFNQIKVMAMITGTPTISWGTTYFVNKEAPTIEEGHYDFYFDYDNNLGGWVLGAVTKG